MTAPTQTDDPWKDIPSISTMDELVKVVKRSRRRIYEHIRDNELVPHYNGSKPQFYRADVIKFLESRPTERAS